MSDQVAKVRKAVADFTQTKKPEPLYQAVTETAGVRRPRLPLGSNDDVDPIPFDEVTAAWHDGEIPDDVYEKCGQIMDKGAPRT